MRSPCPRLHIAVAVVICTSARGGFKLWWPSSQQLQGRHSSSKDDAHVLSSSPGGVTGGEVC